MFESQYSSTNYFDNSIKELDIMVELAKTIPGHIGARLSGGGFGGITVHLVKADQAEQYCKTLAAYTVSSSCRLSSPRSSRISRLTFPLSSDLCSTTLLTDSNRLSET